MQKNDKKMLVIPCFWHITCYDFKRLAIVDSRRFKGSRSDEPRRMQVLDLYCLTGFESEVQVEE